MPFHFNNAEVVSNTATTAKKQNADPTQSPTVRRAPSRFDNPFATCWTQPGAIRYLESDYGAASLLDQLSNNGDCGQIVGPHGVGKSTLVASLREALQREGCETNLLTFVRGKQRPSLPDRSSPQSGRAILFVDGFEQLSLVEKVRLAHRCRKQSCGLVVTLHHELGRVSPVQGWLRLPVLARLEPSLAIAQQLFAQLVADRPTPVTGDDLAISYRRCHGNLRDVWFELYDQHEQGSSRPGQQKSAYQQEPMAKS